MDKTEPNLRLSLANFFNREITVQKKETEWS